MSPPAPPRLHLPAGSAADGGDPVVVTPEGAGWTYSGLRVVRLGPGESRAVETGPDEMLVLPLSGSCVVGVDGHRFVLAGRRSVFSRVTDFAYVPIEARVEIASDTGGEFALPAARAGRRLDPRHGPAEKVPVEVRGAGGATRQVTNLCTPETFPADRLMAVEVLTPAGNWSSYPPHKHDERREGEAELEEIYYYRIAGGGGFGFHRTYAADGSFDVSAAVADGDVFLVPRGYHGPCAASPDHDMYYLNVLAGPGPGRSMAFRDDPAHHWVRGAWEGRAPDARVPLTTAEGALPP
ncbi:MAG TPA: 5-deoxy-glucuronate isomerase [Vicinamibacteria bacterium]|nr:5-deoxy-glucuronate isomerase [Vicinamibacteria bacterium]